MLSVKSDSDEPLETEKKKEYQRVYQKQYYVKNKEKIMKYNLEYYSKNREKIAERYKTKYVGKDGILTTYHKEYYHKHRDKIRKYYNERYKTKGIQWYKNNKKRLLLRKKQRYHLTKGSVASQKKPPDFLSLIHLEDKIIELPSNIPIVKSSCQAKTNEIIKNLEILKIKAEIFKKSLTKG
jgi:hypothetical protein